MRWAGGPISTPRPLVDIPRSEVAAGIGAYGLWVDAKRRAEKAGPTENPADPLSLPAGTPENVGGTAAGVPSEPDSLTRTRLALCDGCGSQFPAARATRRFCSQRCQKRERRAAA
jgi:hypothetical protein